MPREPRYIEPGTNYHIISRFVDREWLIKKTYERELYIKLLGVSLEKTDWRLYAYAVMSNHIHLAAMAGEQPLGEWIRHVHSPFATAMNRAYDRIGPMFVRGPKAFPVEPEGFGSLLAYIHNNPVRAGLCDQARLSDWTSHRAYTADADAPAWLDVPDGLHRSGFNDVHAFDAWVRDPARRDTELVFTEEHYKKEKCEARDRVVARRESAKHSTAEYVVAATAGLLDLSSEQLRTKSRGTSELLAREVVVRCATAAGVSGRAIAEILNLSEARVSTLRQAPLNAVVRALCDEVQRQVDARSTTQRTESRCLSEGV